MGWDADEQLLKTAGADAEHLETGCCGLAGNFGFQPGHGEVSVACAEQRPAAQAARGRPGAVVLADGFSCRTQIHELDSGGREAMHLAELLAAAATCQRNGLRRPRLSGRPRPAGPRRSSRRPGS